MKNGLAGVPGSVHAIWVVAAMGCGVSYSSGGTSQRLGFLSWEPVAWKLYAKRDTVIFAARIWWCLGIITWIYGYLAFILSILGKEAKAKEGAQITLITGSSDGYVTVLLNSQFSCIERCLALPHRPGVPWKLT